MKTDILETINTVVSKFLSALDFPYTKIEIVEESEILRINIQTDRAPFLIGTHGDRLDALQHIIKKIIWNSIPHSEEESISLVVDVDGYRKNQEEKILRIAQEKADAAKNSQISQLMPSLDPYLRKRVHLYIKEVYPELTTKSIDGDGPRKRIQILMG
ncbi:hypothetical protein IPN35_05435 [Candidatus Peregrinibacteria bacterium]|nr:MAG: hypothetical protein IPN35_05435 [Candidatus Peregrinibacteria bacterium]